MKASKLIEKLQEKILNNGDYDVILCFHKDRDSRHSSILANCELVECYESVKPDDKSIYLHGEV